MKTINFEEALQRGGEDSFSIGKDLIMVNDFSVKDLGESSVQLGFLVIGLCRNGEATFQINGNDQKLSKGSLFISLGGQVFKGTTVSDDFHITFVLMSRQFAQDCIVGLNYMWPYLLYVMKNPVMVMNEEEQSWLWDCYSLLYHRAHKKPGRYMREAIVALTRAFYFEICNLLDSRVVPDDHKKHNRAYEIFDKFIRILSQNYKQHRSVEWYSNEMFLTPKYLSEVVKLVSGRNASQWISTLVMIELKRLLQDSSYTIKKITNEMNFPNQSFLGKYFKKVEGLSPSEYRKRCQETEE